MTTKRGIRLTGATMMGVVAGVLVAPPALADVNPIPPVMGGTMVRLGTDSGKGPLLAPGLYQSTVPASTGSYSFRVHREKNETLSVGILNSYYWKNGAWVGTDSRDDEFSFHYRTAAGDACGDPDPIPMPSDSTPGGLYSSLTVTPKPTAMSRSFGSDSPACRAATDFVATVERRVVRSDAPDVPTQISVVRAPAVSGGSSKASINGLAEMSTAALDPTSEAKPGDGWAGATTLAPGGYSLPIAPGGRRAFFRVHLGWGQRMSVGWQLPQQGRSLPTTVPLRASVLVFNPILSGANITGTAPNELELAAGASSPRELGSYTVPIEDGNNDLPLHGEQQSAWWQTMPGWYYIVVGLGPTAAGARQGNFPESATVPTTLSIRVEGQPQAGPTMAIKQPPAGSISGPSEGSKVAAPVWGGVTALGTLAVAGLAVFLWRRSRTS